MKCVTGTSCKSETNSFAGLALKKIKYSAFNYFWILAKIENFNKKKTSLQYLAIYLQLHTRGYIISITEFCVLVIIGMLQLTKAYVFLAVFSVTNAGMRDAENETMQ